MELNKFHLIITLLVGEKLFRVIYYTPGRGKIVPLNIIYLNKETSQLAGKCYKDSDYTLVIAIVQ